MISVGRLKGVHRTVAELTVDDGEEEYLELGM
jgi:hypothetical protein